MPQPAKDPLFVFIAINFLLGIILSLLVGLTGGRQSPLMAVGYLTMFIPAITVMIMRFQYREPPFINWNLFPARWVLPAILAMPFVIHVVCLPVAWLLNHQELPWQSWLISSDGFYHTPDSFNWGTLSKSQLITRISLNAVAGLVIVSFLALWEEIGWRGWMLPRLLKRWSVRKAILVGALIWALWHLPFIVSGILYIPGLPLRYFLVLHPVGILGAGLIISWFWIRTKSIWIVALAHGALNDWGQFAFKFMEESKGPMDTVYLFAAVNATLLALGLILLFTINKTHDDE